MLGISNLELSRLDVVPNSTLWDTQNQINPDYAQINKLATSIFLALHI